MRTGAVILAAGKANRFGSPKQLLEINGETLIDRACRTALEARCDPVLRVLGAHAETLLERPCPAGIETFVHVGWEKGMGDSLAAGVTRLMELCPDLDAVFVLLADQPMVTTSLLAAMKTGFKEASVVWCDGPPALFARRHFRELMALQGDRGAKTVAANHLAATVAFPEAVWDIDSPEAWQRFQAAYPE